VTLDYPKNNTKQLAVSDPRVVKNKTLH